MHETELRVSSGWRRGFSFRFQPRDKAWWQTSRLKFRLFGRKYSIPKFVEAEKSLEWQRWKTSVREMVLWKRKYTSKSFLSQHYNAGTFNNHLDRQLRAMHMQGEKKTLRKRHSEMGNEASLPFGRKRRGEERRKNLGRGHFRSHFCLPQWGAASKVMRCWLNRKNTKE